MIFVQVLHQLLTDRLKYTKEQKMRPGKDLHPLPAHNSGSEQNVELAFKWSSLVRSSSLS